jgi:predicted Zn-dependent peptidase
VYVPAGSIYEDDKTRGISHLLEHMVLKHTKKYTEKQLLAEITSIGGKYNAVTDRDVTFYFIMSHIDNFKKCVDILQSAVQEPVFTEQELDVERKVVLEEIKKRQDNDADLYNLSYFTVLAPDNKYVMPVEGYEKTLNNITVNDLNAYFKSKYQNIMIMINCDSRKRQHVEKYVLQKFGPQKLVDNDAIREMYGSIGYRSSIIIASRKYSQFSVQLLFPSFPRAMTKEVIVLEFIRYCLVSAGLYSILMYELRSKRGLVYGISSINENYRYIGIFRISLSTSYSKIDHILSLIMNVLTDLKNKGLSAKILEYYRKGYINEQKYALTSNEFKTMLYGETLFYGNTPLNDKEYIHTIRNITNDDIKEVATNVFDYNKMGILAYGDFHNKKRLQQQLLDVIDSYPVSNS